MWWPGDLEFLWFTEGLSESLTTQLTNPEVNTSSKKRGALVLRRSWIKISKNSFFELLQSCYLSATGKTILEEKRTENGLFTM